MNYLPIENYGVIGDLNTVALVSLEGSIDFMCFPRFDSPSIFAALLDSERGGHFQIAPASGDFKRRQRYLPDTNILLTQFLSQTGVAVVSDFMPVQHLGHQHNLVRRAKAVRGETQFRMVCAPAFDYGRVKHSVTGKSGDMLLPLTQV
jgi:GH15 family glucan-1,4-alpha-glucosidase